MNLFAARDSIEKIDEGRKKAGYLGFQAMLGLADRGIVVFDPFSTLISEKAVLESGNIFYPGTVIEVSSGGKVEIGCGNVFWPGTILRSAGGGILVGDGSEFGPGGVVLTAGPGETIEIGDRCRLNCGATIQGKNSLGTGSQVLGAITLRGCVLRAGEDYRNPDPDVRGSVLKGSGFASGLSIERGEVINGRNELLQSMAELQRRYHPGAPGVPGGTA